MTFFFLGEKFFSDGMRVVGGGGEGRGAGGGRFERGLRERFDKVVQNVKEVSRRKRKGVGQGVGGRGDGYKFL